MIRRFSFVILPLVVVAGYLFAQKTSSFNGFELADRTGKILRKPADYRDHYEILGSWTVETLLIPSLQALNDAAKRAA